VSDPLSVLAVTAVMRLNELRNAIGDEYRPGGDELAYIAFLARIRRLFTTPSPYLEVIADAFADGTLKQPAQPMSDQELARAIRDFQSMPMSDASLKKLGARFAQPKPEN
jgi:hypothetical protein